MTPLFLVLLGFQAALATQHLRWIERNDDVPYATHKSICVDSDGDDEGYYGSQKPKTPAHCMFDDSYDTDLLISGRHIYGSSLSERVSSAALYGSARSTWEQRQYGYRAGIDWENSAVALDCSCFTSWVLASAAPKHFADVVSWNNGASPSASDYYNYCDGLQKKSLNSTKFSALLHEDIRSGNPVALTGAILAWATPGGFDTGHVMVMVPHPDGTVIKYHGSHYTAHVADSSNLVHGGIDSRCQADDPSDCSKDSCTFAPYNGPGRGDIGLRFSKDGTITEWSFLGPNDDDDWNSVDKKPLCIMRLV